MSGHVCPGCRGARRHWLATAILCWWLIATLPSLAAWGEDLANDSYQPADVCQSLLQETSEALRQAIDARLARGFPVTSQLAEGHARLSPLSVVRIDCQERRIVASGNYAFRGNFGVMDVTRRGTVVLQFDLQPRQEQRQVWLANPVIQDVTFDNPAPWFDGKAISTWAHVLFHRPVCAMLPHGRPC